MGDLKLYQLDEDYEYKLPKKFQKDTMGGIFKFYDKEQNLVLTLDGKSVRIRKGYLWNGASPKIEFLGIIIGTYDGEIDPETGKPITYYATCVHDAMCICQKENSFFYTRREIDLIFYHMLKEAGWKHSRLYFLAVRIYSKLTFQDY